MQPRYTYTGHTVPTLVPTALWEGYRDRGFLPAFDQLYRTGRVNRALYRAGWLLGGLRRG